MKEAILLNLNNPGQLERLYRSDKQDFKHAFTALYPELQDNVLLSYWNERLHFTNEGISWGTSKDLAFILIAAFLAGTVAKLPMLLHLDEEFFYPRNIGFIVFPVLATYFAWKNKLSINKIAFIGGAMTVGLIFINLLPNSKRSDTLILSCIHLLLFLWSLLGLAFVGKKQNDLERRLSFLKYNGDLLVITALIIISGALMTGITIGLFTLIGVNITQFYFEYIVVYGLAAVPIVGTILTQTNPQLVGRVSPVIARIFSPLVLVMLVIYLISMVYTSKDPYNDREFLLIFNALLVGVMAIIFFSIAEGSNKSKGQAELWILFLLSGTTILVNSVALSAILFRISEWGITPNRMAVLGGNILILINLLLVATRLFKVITKKQTINRVENAIASYLPIYCIWTIIVTFIFPLIFKFK